MDNSFANVLFKIKENLPGQENHRFQYFQRLLSNEAGSLSNSHVSD